MAEAEEVGIKLQLYRIEFNVDDELHRKIIPDDVDVANLKFILLKREKPEFVNDDEADNEDEKLEGNETQPTEEDNDNKTSNPKAEILQVNILLYFADKTTKIIPILFDDNFKLLNKHVWNQPNHCKNADLITMEKKMEDAAPYNVFFNTLKLCPETQEQLFSINFTDLLCPSFGRLKCSLHLMFTTDITWILSNFATRNLHKTPMTLIHGDASSKWPQVETMAELYPDIDYHYIEKKEGTFGSHHTKLCIFMYDDDSLRVVIGSANLYRPDWDRYDQLLWVSPKCPKLLDTDSDKSGDSPTNFKSDLLNYLFSYKNYEIPTVRLWFERVKAVDFSEIKVALIYNIPGLHYPRRNGCAMHYLGHLLTKDCVIPAPKEEHDLWRIVAQTASLGLAGETQQEWLTTNFLKSLSSHRDSPYLPSLFAICKTDFCLIYPTMQNCLDAYLGYLSAGCCVYDKGVKDFQPWINQYLYQWKADKTKRTRAISHSKSYCRISPCLKKMAYFFLTSANFSRSGWGMVPNRDSGIFLRSHELGVLFLPKYFGEEYFEIAETPNRKNPRLFPIMFDLPLTRYESDDEPYCPEEMIELINGLIASKPEKKVPSEEPQGDNAQIPEDKKEVSDNNTQRPEQSLFFPAFKKN